MLLPKGGVNWKAARARLPPTRAIWRFLTQTKVLLAIAVTGIILLLWNGFSGTAGEMQRYAAPHWSSPHPPEHHDNVVWSMADI
jgi:hypothetical protein